MSTKIEWTSATWNPVTGCTKVSPGCLNCYIERTPPMRMKGRKFDRKGCIPVELHPDRLDWPMRRRKPLRIFVNSMSDLFHEDVPFDFIDKVFAVMALAPRHTFQVLTKRPERMREYMAWEREGKGPVRGSDRCLMVAQTYYGELCGAIGRGGQYADRNMGLRDNWPLSNVWLGVSAEDQERADKRIPLLLLTPAAVRFVSLEPLLGPVDLFGKLGPYCGKSGSNGWDRGLDWVIVGGESGPGARPMHPQWPRDVRDKCAAAGVPFFFKQWGEWAPGTHVERQSGWMEVADFFAGKWSFGRENLANDEGHIDDEPDVYRVGKRAAGRLLDGAEHNGMPAPGDERP